MNRKILATLFASFLFSLLMGATASAQFQRTFVSGLGNDGNPCSRTAPCRAFARAISQTDAAGEVVVLDSAGYGPFTITRSVTVVAPPGVYAGISVFGGYGIEINAGASDTVILRGLSVNNLGSGLGGIVFITGGTLHVDSCVVNGFSAGGVGLGAIAPNSHLEVKDSIFRSNSQGVQIGPASASISSTVDHTTIEGNGNGIALLAGSKVTVRNSVLSGNEIALQASSPIDAANSDLNVESCVVSNNANAAIVAISSSTGVATVRVSNCTITNNGAGLFNGGGARAVILSRGNNTVEGNGTDTFGTIGSYTAR